MRSFTRTQRFKLRSAALDYLHIPMTDQLSYSMLGLANLARSQEITLTGFITKICLGMPMLNWTIGLLSASLPTYCPYTFFCKWTIYVIFYFCLPFYYYRVSIKIWNVFRLPGLSFTFLIINCHRQIVFIIYCARGYRSTDELVITPNGKHYLEQFELNQWFNHVMAICRIYLNNQLFHQMSYQNHLIQLWKNRHEDRH